MLRPDLLGLSYISGCDGPCTTASSLIRFLALYPCSDICSWRINQSAIPRKIAALALTFWGDLRRC